ncbi:MAG TPA: Ig-like domain-containing protein [Bacilli bacterium]|nr:Ig-like domain-containing protein [Bacilli bacterium]
MKKLSVLCFLLLSVFLFVACDKPVEDPIKEDVKPTAVEVTNPVTTMKIGDTSQLQWTITPSDAVNKEVNFASSDNTIVSVDPSGNLQALKAGIVTITVTCLADVNVKTSFSIEVAEAEIEEVKPTLSVSNKDITLRDSLTDKIKVSLDKGTYPDATIQYTSLAPTIVSVDANGNVTGLKGGKATIEVVVKDFPETKVSVTVEVYQKITVSNPTTIYLGEQAQLEFLIDGTPAPNVQWSTLEEKVATVDGTGKVTSVAVGEVVIRGVSGYYTYEATVSIITNPNIPVSLEVTMDASLPIFLDSSIKLNVTVTPATASPEVVWTTSKDFIATINEHGVPNFTQGGDVVFTATSTVDPTVSASISVKMPSYMNPENWVKQIKYDVVLQEVIYVHGMQAQSSDEYRGPLKLLPGSISKYFFTDLVIDETRYRLKSGAANYPEKAASSIDFITVHSAGSYEGSGASLGNCEYTNSCNGASWHFSVGSDGIFQSIPTTEIAWHAGDGTSIKNKWYDTGIKATENVPGYVTFSDDGYYIVNNQKSTLKASQTFNGGTVITVNSQTRLPYTGINTKIGANGNYYVGTIWWSNTYKTLSNKGGNLNSIGIESSVNQSENIMHTWSNLAKLVGELCRVKRLDPVFAVKQHNTFSGKDCPMTMRHAGKWEYFMDMVYAEYNAAKFLKGFTIQLIENSPYVASNGLITSYPNVDTEVEYQVRIFNNSVGYDQTFTVRTIIPAAKEVNAANAFHIRSTYDIIRPPYQG